MELLLSYFLVLPLISLLISFFLPAKRESHISGIVIGSIALHLVAGLVFVLYWLLHGYPLLNSKLFTLYSTGSFEFFIDFHFDRATAVFSIVGSMIALFVSIFSRTYMHREEGFKRYFVTILLFFFGYQMVIFSGNFETLFIGWEVLGICSFLLIAFYRDRYLPAKNSLKVISIYRLGDICLMLVMWLIHHIFHKNITFSQLILPSELITYDHQLLTICVSILIMIAVAAKSALLPFSSWLPRAMEGPTTSSAVFYGALSIHLGVFLLLRTYPLWESLFIIKCLWISLGLLTALIASSISRVQSTVKTQIAYASIAQIGLMVVEIAMGWHGLALIHFAGNAFLRTYQLLISPSVLSYKIHDMVFNYKPLAIVSRNTWWSRWSDTFYVLNIKEWNLDTTLFKFLWNPFKKFGNRLTLPLNKTSYTIIPVMLSFGMAGFIADDHVHHYVDHSFTLITAISALIMILTAFTERGSAIRAWNRLGIAQGLLSISVALNEDFSFYQVMIYLSGIMIAYATGLYSLYQVKQVDQDIILDRFHGYSHNQKKMGLLFLVSCLGLIGLPFTPTFLGIDLLFFHIQYHQVLFVILTALSFIFIELSALRIYARLFMGQYKKADHAMAYRSS
ncbi:MAG: proton-conducting transporter membrane subunit [Saprospiraceae bacterium]